MGGGGRREKGENECAEIRKAKDGSMDREKESRMKET